MIDFIYIFKSKRRAWEFLVAPEPFIITSPKRLQLISPESIIYLGCLNYWGKPKDDKTPIIFGRGKINYILTNYLERIPSQLQNISKTPEHVMVESRGLSIRLYFTKDSVAIMDSAILERNDKFSLIIPLVRLLNWPKKDSTNVFIPFDGEQLSNKLYELSRTGNHKTVSFYSNFKIPKYKIQNYKLTIGGLNG